MNFLGASGDHLLQMQDYLQEASCCAFSLDQARQVKIMVGQCKLKRFKAFATADNVLKDESFGELKVPREW